jgi:membrane protein YqaA with SNARE-associated domain
MRLDARAFGLAAGTTAAALFIVCAAAVAIAPGPTTAFAGYLIHTDLSGLSRSLTFGNFVGGLVGWALGTALTFWLVAAIYNRLIRLRSTAPVTGPRPAVQGV